ncbi:MAG: hypothetical protein ACRCXT_09125 [Paraclostridium sp.]
MSDTTTATNKQSINNYALIISMYLLILFIDKNLDKFSDAMFGKVVLCFFLFFEFLFIAGAMEMIKKGTYFYKLILNSLFTYLFYKGFINYNNDMFKFILLFLAIISVYNIINAIWNMLKDIIAIDNTKSKFKNGFLFIANLATFILAIIQIADIIKT